MIQGFARPLPGLDGTNWSSWEKSFPETWPWVGWGGRQKQMWGGVWQCACHPSSLGAEAGGLPRVGGHFTVTLSPDGSGVGGDTTVGLSFCPEIPGSHGELWAEWSPGRRLRPCSLVSPPSGSGAHAAVLGAQPAGAAGLQRPEPTAGRAVAWKPGIDVRVSADLSGELSAPGPHPYRPLTPGPRAHPSHLSLQEGTLKM